MVQPALKKIQVASLSGVAFLLMCEKLFSVKKQKPPPGIEMRTCFEYFRTSIYVMCIRRPAAVAAIFSYPAHDIGLFSFNFFCLREKENGTCFAWWEWDWMYFQIIAKAICLFWNANNLYVHGQLQSTPHFSENTAAKKGRNVEIIAKRSRLRPKQSSKSSC